MARKRRNYSGAGLAELIYDPIGALFDGSFQPGAYGGHETHVHAASANPYVMLAILRKALHLGLGISENPLFDHVDPVHVENSWHYRDFPGKYSLAGHHGTLGEAADLSGNAADMAHLFRFARWRFADAGPTSFGGGGVGGGGGGARGGGGAGSGMQMALQPLSVQQHPITAPSPTDLFQSLLAQSHPVALAAPGIPNPSQTQAATLAAELSALQRSLLAA